MIDWFVSVLVGLLAGFKSLVGPWPSRGGQEKPPIIDKINGPFTLQQGVPLYGGGVREQYDRLIEGSPLFIPGYECNSLVVPSDLDRLLEEYRLTQTALLGNPKCRMPPPPLHPPNSPSYNPVDFDLT